MVALSVVKPMLEVVPFKLDVTVFDSYMVHFPMSDAVMSKLLLLP